MDLLSKHELKNVPSKKSDMIFAFSTCIFVLLQISKTKPWKCTPQQRVIHKKFLFSICDFLRYFLKNGIPIPSTIGDMHASTPVLLKLRLDNTWSTVNVSVKKF